MSYTPYGFIPGRLSSLVTPELANFPMNILFASYGLRNGRQVRGLAIYCPDLDIIKQRGKKLKMYYWNQYNTTSWVEITYDQDKGSYRGDKSVQGEHKLMALGANWKQFFIHLTMSGLSEGEGCEFEFLSGSPSSTDVDNKTATKELLDVAENAKLIKRYRELTKQINKWEEQHDK